MQEIVLKVQDFDLGQTLDCGQAFRWNQIGEKKWQGVVQNYFCIAEQKGDALYIQSNNCDESFWADYFDLNRDYAVIKAELSKNRVIAEAIKTSGGIHILKQDLWECLVSFIISANNNIPRIKKIIEALCMQLGVRNEELGITYYTFPRAEDIVGKDLSSIKAGFRAKYISELAERVTTGAVKLEGIDKAGLCDIKGVGNKIADCVRLFALGDMSSFPVDVWIERIMENEFELGGMTVQGFAMAEFGEYAGIAQQYLYNHYRNNI